MFELGNIPVEYLQIRPFEYTPCECFVWKNNLGKRFLIFVQSRDSSYVLDHSIMKAKESKVKYTTIHSQKHATLLYMYSIL